MGFYPEIGKGLSGDFFPIIQFYDLGLLVKWGLHLPSSTTRERLFEYTKKHKDTVFI